MDNRLQCQKCSSTDLKKNFWGTYTCNVCFSKGYRTVSWFGDFHNSPRKGAYSKKPIRQEIKRKSNVKWGRIILIAMAFFSVGALYYWGFTGPTKENNTSNGFEFGQEAIEANEELKVEVSSTTLLRNKENHMIFVFLYQNQSDKIIRRPRVLVTLLDDKGKQITQKTAFAMRSRLFPNESTAIRAVFAPYSQYYSHHLKPRASTSKNIQPRATITIHNAKLRAEENHFVIDGQLQNLSAEDLTRVYLSALIFDENDNIIAMEFGQLSQDILATGQKGTFQIKIDHLKAKPARFKLDYEAISGSSGPPKKAGA